MGRYCKAYRLGELRGYSGWRHDPRRARPASPAAGPDLHPRSLDDESIVYLQEDHTVTDGIFLAEHLLFDAVTPDWIDFCRTRLGFAPELALASRRPAEAPTAR